MQGCSVLRQGICTPWGRGALGTVFLTAPEEKCLSGCFRALLGDFAHPSIPGASDVCHRACHWFVGYRSQPAPHTFSNIITSTRLEELQQVLRIFFYLL